MPYVCNKFPSLLFCASVSKLPGAQKIKLTFDLRRLTPDEALKKVELRFHPLNYFGSRECAKNIRFRLTLKDTERNAEATRTFRSNTEKQTSTDSYVVADLSRYVQSLERSVGPISAHSVLELVFRSSRRLENQADKSLNPGLFLVVYTDSPDITKEFNQRVKEASKSRTKRSTRSRGYQHECQAVRYMVDLRKIGWSNYILNPPVYWDNYCTGKCPSQYLLTEKNPTLHGLVQSQMREIDKTIPELCCVPIRLQPLKFLIIDSSGNMVLKNFSDIVADQCGCR